MRALDSETFYELCRRADDAVMASRELIARARAELDLALAYLQHQAYFDGSSRRH